MRKYILGMLTAICAVPILESLTELIQVVIEVPKGMLTKKVMVLNKDIQDLQAAMEPVATSCIGFEAPNAEYYDDDDEYEDKQNNKIGF